MKDIPENRQGIDKFIPILLLGVIAFHLILAGYWIRTDATPPYWDEAWYLYQGAVQYDALRNDGIAGWYTAWTNVDRNRPSLASTLTIPFFAAFGISDDAGLLLNLAGLTLLLLATYSLGTSIHNRRSGLLATLIVGGYPVVVGLVHILLVELVMVALVAATLLALWQSDGFRHTGWSVTAGLLIGLGLLTKVFYPVFVAGPWLVMAFQAIRRDEGEKRFILQTQLCNMLTTLLIPVFVAGSWYIPNLKPMLARSIDAAVGTEASPYGPAHPLHRDSLVTYFRNFVWFGTSAFGFLAFLAGVIGLGIASLRLNKHDAQPQRASARHPILFLASSILMGYALFTSLRNQDLKHITGILPAMAVLSGWGITKLNRSWWPVVTCGVGIMMLLQTVMGTMPGLFGLAKPVFMFNNKLLLFYPAQHHFRDTRYAYPDPTPWPLSQILAYVLQVADLASLHRNQVHVGIIPDYPGIDEPSLRFEIYRQRLPIQVEWAEPFNLSNQDVLIHKTGDLGFLEGRISSIEAVMARLKQPNSGFQLMPRTFALPDGSEVLIYARKPSPHKLKKHISF